MTDARKKLLFGLAPLLIGSVGLAYFIKTVAAEDAPSAWLVWRYLVVLGEAALFGAGALFGGFALTRLFGLAAVSLRERLVFGFALGVLGWALLTVVLGLVHALGAVTFFVVPLAAIGIGAPGLVSTLARARRLFRRLRASRDTVWTTVARGFGLICLFVVWLPLLVPGNVAYDSRWYHLPLAEQYAAVGAVFRLDEGFFNGTMPHLASYLYTWAFLTPVGQLFDQLVLASHFELVIFLATVASLPVLIDKLVPRPRSRASWVAFFLFPGIFLYDSSLGAAADHMLAFWGVPIFLALWRFVKSPTRRAGVLFGTMLGAAALTKYQAILLVAAPIAVTVLLALVGVIRKNRRAWLVAGLLAGAAALVAFSPHWLLNLIWHHDPLYPSLSSIFPSTPLVEGTANAAREPAWIPQGTLSERLTQTVLGTLRFGFEAHDWSTFHGNRPVYGSLFLIAATLLPFVQRRRRLLGLMLATWSALPLWYWSQHQDRYLQALVPWAAAFVAAVLIGVWRRTPLARPVVFALVAFQLLHTADLATLPANSVLGGNPLHAVIDLIASHKREAPDELIHNQFTISRARAVLPADATVLVHDYHLHLGLGRRAIRDNVQRQGGIHWAILGSSRAATDLLKSYGVTHLYWFGSPLGWSGIGDDIVFYRLVQQSSANATPLNDGTWVAPLAYERLQSDESRLLVLGCAAERLTPRELNARWDSLRSANCGAAMPDDLDAQLASSEIVVVDTRKHQSYPRLEAEFASIFTRDSFKVWGRR